MIIWKEIDLSFKDKTIFKNFSLTINTGEKVLLSSKSGSGKTTLLRTALGLIPPDSGNITINKTTLNPGTVESIRGKIFYLNQDVTLADNIVYDGIKEIFNYKANKKKYLSKKKLCNYLKEFYLDRDILDKKSKELSGGERQRVGLIIGLLLNRPIWLLDEPTSALDKKLKEKVKKIIMNLNKTIVIISHDSCWSDLKKIDWSKTYE